MPAERAHQDFAAVFSAIKNELACPACFGTFRLESDELICTGCDRKYPIVDGIPVLIPGSESP